MELEFIHFEDIKTNTDNRIRSRGAATAAGWRFAAVGMHPERCAEAHSAQSSSLLLGFFRRCCGCCCGCNWRCKRRLGCWCRCCLFLLVLGLICLSLSIFAEHLLRLPSGVERQMRRVLPPIEQRWPVRPADQPLVVAEQLTTATQEQREQRQMN